MHMWMNNRGSIRCRYLFESSSISSRPSTSLDASGMLEPQRVAMRRPRNVGGAPYQSKTAVVRTQKAPMTKIPFGNYAGSQTKHRSLDEAASEVGREIDVRRRLYDKWVGEGRLTWVDAHDRLERLLAALQFLTGRRPVSESAAPIDGFDAIHEEVERQASVPYRAERAEIPLANATPVPVP